MFERLQGALTVSRYHHAVVASGHCLSQQVEAVLAAEIKIQQEAVVKATLQPVAGLVEVRNSVEARASACQFATHAKQALTDESFVLDDQDAHANSMRPYQPASSGPCVKHQPPG